MLKQPPKGKTCPAILGLVEDGEEVMEDFQDSAALDAGLISGAQAVEQRFDAAVATISATSGTSQVRAPVSHLRGAVPCGRSSARTSASRRTSTSW